ncbi:Lrp/AsnC family transcriptional regulator [Marispirochaeta sp.]|jgi:Lrp/AsnC family transcriptional regulator, regulator for asnA, asnC and gidA|uniref:Lrp/AsnC family transcriptional regulator n=1 Tax=Marispirochaeta sp. TaxID=2038653 RepID=UPI0029C70D3D|nr:Lrp/AsnC family transcriptional regulator [Marispirochaeta sp.]
MPLDELNRAILYQLKDGRRSFRRIAEEIAVTENTVRSRVNRMLESGVMEIRALVEPEAVPGGQLAVVGIKLATMDLVNKGEEISRLKGVVSVKVVTGRFDLIIEVLLTEGFGLLEFYTQEVSRVQEIDSVETFIVYKSYNSKVPFNQSPQELPEDEELSGSGRN